MMGPLGRAEVALRYIDAEYPSAPFHPPRRYPEWDDNEIPLDTANEVYDTVRQLLVDLGFDTQHIGSSAWDPLSELIVPGNRVVIKPNLVFHKHPLGCSGVASMITHGSVIRPLVDYAWKALRGKGEIIVCDVPLQSADWDVLIAKSGLADMATYLREHNVNMRLVDLRLARSSSDANGLVTKLIPFHGDPEGYVAVDLSSESLLMPIIDRYRRLAITDYPPRTVAQHHNPSRNEYLISKSILSADVFLNVPKLKTHKKGGVTLSLKNLIGINGDKSWIAHHLSGGIKGRGDEFPSIGRWSHLKFKIFVGLKHHPIGVAILRVILPILHWVAMMQRKLFPSIKSTIIQFSNITEGSWYGNDTLWRVILDLNRILLYADAEGRMQQSPQRSYFTLIDGLWAGERNGPMHHIPKKANMLLAATNPVFADLVTSYAMGFDTTKIPQIEHAFDAMRYPLTRTNPDSLSVIDNGERLSYAAWKDRPTLAFLAPNSWKGHVEHARRRASDEIKDIPKILENVGGE